MAVEYILYAMNAHSSYAVLYCTPKLHCIVHSFDLETVSLNAVQTNFRIQSSVTSNHRPYRSDRYR
jgi:hypothetical protein